MKPKINKLFPLGIVFLFSCLIFWKSIVYGLVPIPFDQLVTGFFPYNNGGWTQVGAFPQPKGGWYAVDAIRQMYPWKELVIDQLKNGQIPLWNPYNFSGYPLLANIQSAVFYPLNLVFLIPSFPWSWTAYIALAVLLPAYFMFHFLRSLDRSPLASVISAIAFAGAGQMIDWLEWGVITHTFIWLPLSLYSINRFTQKKDKKYLLLFIFSIISAIFSGYPQRAAYSLIVIVLWIFMKWRSQKKSSMKHLVPISMAFLLAISMTAVQWIPTAEFYFHSAMRGEVSEQLSERGGLPWQQLATIFAPDYFGNRVTNNYWAKDFGNIDYMDADLYIGASVIPLILLAIFSLKNNKHIKFLTILTVIGLLLGIRSPISGIVSGLGIPVISTGVASEALIITVFSLAALAAFGFDDLKSEISFKRRLTSITITGAIYALLIFMSLTFDQDKTRTALRNLVVPGTAFLGGAGAMIVFIKFKKSTIPALLFIGFLSVELLFHSNKMLSFSSPNLAYPEHILFSELNSIAGNDRVAGFWETEISPNIQTAVRMNSIEGYDPLYILRYGEFISSAQQGRLEKIIPRSDADLEQKNEQNRNRVLDLTSVKYIPAKVTKSDELWEQEPLKYNPQRFKLVWLQDRFKIYENLHALPRVKLYSDWEVIESDEQIIEKLYDPTFNPQSTVILEHQPLLKGSEPLNGKVRITSYEPNRVDIESQSNIPAILLLTDSYYPGWKATVDEKPVDILRANYTFRAIEVPEGNHNITFSYQPISFKVGSLISIVSTIVVSGLIYTKKIL